MIVNLEPYSFQVAYPTLVINEYYQCFRCTQFQIYFKNKVVYII